MQKQYKLSRKKTSGLSGSLSAIAWRRFRKNRLSFFFLGIICLAAFISLLGYLISPDSTPYANNQCLELGLKKPGFSVTMLRVLKKDEVQQRNIFSRMLFGQPQDFINIPVFKYYFKDGEIFYEEFTGDIPNDGAWHSVNLVEITFLLKPGTKPEIRNNFICFTDINGTDCKHSVSELQNQIIKDHISRKTFLLGTDRFGRDVLSQLIIGTRVSLSVGFISVLISLIVGILLGSLAGFFRGWVDNLATWFINVVWSIPTLLLVIAITFALGKGFWQIFIAVGLTMWVEVARIVRGQILGIREKEYIEASIALGYKNSRIIFRHILPNIMGPVIVISAGNFASAILIEAGLSFLGLGVQPPVPSWGSMIKENYGYIVLDYAYLAILPGLAIMIMVLAFMMVGNGLRDSLDVRDVKANG